MKFLWILLIKFNKVFDRLPSCENRSFIERGNEYRHYVLSTIDLVGNLYDVIISANGSTSHLNSYY